MTPYNRGCVFYKGCGDNNSRNVPTLVKDVSNVDQVACGSAHTICISKDGCTVWSFGSGDNGKFFSDSFLFFSFSFAFKFSGQRLLNWL